MSEHLHENIQSIQEISPALILTADGRIVLRPNPEQPKTEPKQRPGTPETENIQQIISEGVREARQAIKKTIYFIKDTLDINDDPFSHSAVKKTLYVFIEHKFGPNSDNSLCFKNYVERYGTNVETILEITNLFLHRSDDFRRLAMFQPKTHGIESWEKIKKILSRRQKEKQEGINPDDKWHKKTIAKATKHVRKKLGIEKKAA